MRHRPLLQFALTDAILVSALTFIGMICLTPFIGHIFMATDMSGRPINTSGTVLCAIVIAIITVAGAAVGIWFANRCVYPEMPRTPAIGWTVIVCWMFTVFICSPATHHQGYANQEIAVRACRAYAEGQEISKRTDSNRDGIYEYGASLKSMDAAYVGCDRPFDRQMVAAEGQPGKVPPKCGYVFKVLTRQGSHVLGGAGSYLVADSKGMLRMTGGYALAACPAEYNLTGRNIYLINQDGRIYWKDCGEQTHKTFVEMTEFNPDNSWTAEFDPYEWSSPE
jgi:hypothetical protein